MKTEGVDNNGVITFTPDRLIQEPVVFLGMTDSEVIGITLFSVVICLPLSVLLLLPVGMGLLGVCLGFGLSLVCIYVAGKQLTVIKRQYPDGLHRVYIQQYLQAHTPLHYKYVDYDGQWSIRRLYHVDKQPFIEEEYSMQELMNECDDLTQYQNNQSDYTS